MDVEIFKNSSKKDTYAVVKKGTSSTHLPDGDWRPFKRMTLTPGERRIGIDSDEAIKEIETNGHHIARAGVTFKEGPEPGTGTDAAGRDI